MDNLGAALKHIEFQHGDASGWIAMARKDPQTHKFKQYHYKVDDLPKHLSEWMGEDVYFSQGTFYKP